MKKKSLLVMCTVVFMALMAACGKKEEPSSKENDIGAVKETELEERVEADGEKEEFSEAAVENVSEETEEVVEEASVEAAWNPEDYEYQLCGELGNDEILIGFNMPEGTWEIGSHSLSENNVYSRINLKRSDSEESEWLDLQDGTAVFGFASYWTIDENNAIAIDQEVMENYEKEQNIDVTIVEMEKKESVDTVFGTMDIYFVKEEYEYLYDMPFTIVSGYEWGIIPIADNYVSVRWGCKSYSVGSTDNPQWEQERDNMQYQGTLKNDILPQMFEIQ